MSIGSCRSRILVTPSTCSPGTLTVTTDEPLSRLRSYTAVSFSGSPPKRLLQKPCPLPELAVETTAPDADPVPACRLMALVERVPFPDLARRRLHELSCRTQQQ